MALSRTVSFTLWTSSGLFPCVVHKVGINLKEIFELNNYVIQNTTVLSSISKVTQALEKLISDSVFGFFLLCIIYKLYMCRRGHVLTCQLAFFSLPTLAIFIILSTIVILLIEEFLLEIIYSSATTLTTKLLSLQ